MTASAAAQIAARLSPGMRLAVADGAGAPVGLRTALAEAAREVGDISLLLGWCLEEPVDLELGQFTDVRTIMGGGGLRRPVAAGTVRYVPERYSALPSLLTGPLRPDLVVASLPTRRGSWSWGTEVAWLAALADAGVPFLVEENELLPSTSDDPGPSDDQVTVVARTARPPIVLPGAPVDEVADRIGARLAALIPEGASVQYGPGPLAEATFAALQVPVRIRSGMITESVLALESRGLLLDAPRATYVVGSPEIYSWADGRSVTTRLEHTHRPDFGGPAPFVAINAALEVDVHGAVNVEGAAGHPVAGIGGHPDFALNGHCSIGGLSVVATPTRRRGASTLVERLGHPASTPRTDVDIVVTELGVADLRGLDDAERQSALRAIW